MMKSYDNRYVQLLQLAFRQVMGSMVITTYNNDTIIFMKEISSDGDISTVDVIYPAYPFLLLFNKNILRDVLKPVFIYANNEFSN